VVGNVESSGYRKSGVVRGLAERRFVIFLVAPGEVGAERFGSRWSRASNTPNLMRRWEQQAGDDGARGGGRGEKGEGKGSDRFTARQGCSQHSGGGLRRDRVEY
jgi:hypothetical protein